jgi:hypothetical protein
MIHELAPENPRRTPKMRTTRWLAAGAAVTFALMALPAAAAVTSPAAAVSHSHTHPAIHVSLGGRAAFAPDGEAVLDSGNWAGELALPAKKGNTFRGVTATFTVPSANCNVTPGSAPYGTDASQWVGLDGWSSTTVEQDGVTAQCVGTTPVYSAWFERYPLAPVTSTVAVQPGDAVRATVAEAGGVYTLTLDDLTLGTQQTETARCPSGAKCSDSSAEVISEAPFGTAVLPLADFAMISFSKLGVTGASGSKITHGGFSSASWKEDQVDQIGGTSNKVIDAPGTLYAGGAFDDQWSGEN